MLYERMMEKTIKNIFLQSPNGIELVDVAVVLKKKNLWYLSNFTKIWSYTTTKDGNVFCQIHEYKNWFVYKIIGFVTLIESNVGHSPKIILNTLKPILC